MAKLLLASGVLVLIGVATMSQLPKNSALAAYRSWRKVNEQPHFVPGSLATLCRVPTPAEVEAEKGNPHLNKYVTVYVNKVGESAMFDPKSPVFPVGSVIVKEKLTTASSTEPELLTVMVKRGSGFNPENGDWEYMAITGDAKKIQAQGKLARCQSCHAAWKSSDYVSRAYLRLRQTAQPTSPTTQTGAR